MLALSIGNFDGVHLGHRSLLAEARRLAGDAGRVAAVTFEPHPLALLRPGERPARLTSAGERRRLLLAAGADEVIELVPTTELLGLEPEAFLKRLHAEAPFGAIVEGPDFRFGRGRSGSVETLRRVGASMGFTTAILAEVEVALSDLTLVRASSSMARWLIGRGRVRDARAILGRPHAIVAANEPGDRRGRSIGVPTLNLARAATAELLLPADGVYAGVGILTDGARDTETRHAAAISVGTKPTFGRHERVCEIHLVGADLPMDGYGIGIRVEFHEWLREQLAFASLDDLVAQLARDIRAVTDWHRDAARATDLTVVR